MSTQKLAIGIAAPVILGLALGLGLAPLASGLMAQTVANQPIDGPDPTRVFIEEAAGVVQVRSGRSGWRPVSEGDVLIRPVTMRTKGFDGYVRLRVKGGRLIASREATVHVGSAGLGLTFQVDRGLALAYREKQPIRILVPHRELDVSGKGYGVWVRPDRVNVAVLAEKVDISYRGEDPEKFSFGREVTVRKGAVEPSVMASELTVESITSRRSGSRTRIAARTSINARVYAYGSDGYEEVDLTRGGTFAIQVPGELPEPGALVALDAAGRWAEFNAPSRRLEKVIHDLKTSARRPARPTPSGPSKIEARKDRSRRRADSADSSEGSRRRRRRAADDAAPSGSEPARSKPSGELPSPPPIDDQDDDLDETAL